MMTEEPRSATPSPQCWTLATTTYTFRQIPAHTGQNASAVELSLLSVFPSVKKAKKEKFWIWSRNFLLVSHLSHHGAAEQP